MTPAPWLTDERLTRETAEVGARVIVGCFAPATARNIANALYLRTLAPGCDAADAQEAFLLAFSIREALKGGGHDLGKGSGIDEMASGGRPLGGDTLAGHGLRPDGDADDVGPVGPGDGSVREVRRLGNPWVRVWRLAWGLS